MHACALALILAPALAREDGICTAWLPAVEGARIEVGDLAEISGLAASHAHPGGVWFHEDHQEGPVLYAADTDGGDRGTFTLAGVRNVDWEDLAVGPCPDGEPVCTCLHVADIGDNDLERDGGVVWRVPEPEPLDPGGRTQVGPLDAVHFVYPDGPHDAETLLVDPDTGAVLLVTKEAPARVFAFPGTPPASASEDDPLVLELLDAVDLESLGASAPKASGGAVSPAGLRTVLRTDEDLLLFRGTGAAAFQREPDVLPVPPAGQGEAVAFTPDGRTLLLVSEGTDPHLWSVTCTAFQPMVDDPWDPLVDCRSGCSGCATGGSVARLVAGLLAGLAALGRRRSITVPCRGRGRGPAGGSPPGRPGRG
ncbi:MAG: hypothetical protein JXB39_08435 [Deltaproteobacteria bacterium]|nr:hypothetical protein [Deltaproteobacteria bacterium]